MTTPPSSILPSSKSFYISNPNRPPLQPACCRSSIPEEPTWNPSPVPTTLLLLLGTEVPRIHLQAAYGREPSASITTSSMLSAHLNLCHFLSLCSRGCFDLPCDRSMAAKCAAHC